MSLNIVGSVAPGVLARINTSQISRPASPVSSSTLLAVGYSTWGPVNSPRTVTSFADAAEQFGPLDANSDLMDALYIFFNLFPGDRAVVVRVGGASAAAATVSLSDRGSTAQPTLRISAKYPSSSVDVRYTIENGSKANTFKLTLRSVKLTLRSVKLNAIESFDNLLMDAPSLLRVNSGSRLALLTNLGSTNVAPANIPALVAEALLAGGSDDFAGISAATFIGTDNGTTRTGLQALNSEEFGPGMVTLPGVTTGEAHLALIAHADRFFRPALLDLPLGATKEDAVTERKLYGSNFMAMAWPRPNGLDFAGSGNKRFYPTSSVIAGVCAKAEAEVGVFKAPANYVVPFALGVELTPSGLSQTDDATRKYLNENQVNVIAPFPEQGVKVYGARVASGDNRVQMLHEARTLGQIYYQLKRNLQSLPFSVVDGRGRLFREARSVCATYLRQLWQAGGLYGAREEDAFIVVCDRTNNTSETLDAQRVNVLVGVRISPTAEVVILDINNVPLSTDLSALQQ